MQADNALLAELDSSLESGSQDRSAETLRRLTDLFLGNAEQYRDQQVALFDDVFSRLVEKIEKRALAELSERIAPVEKAPAGLVRHLAQDDAIAVAAPVLTQSPVLTDDDLAAVAQTKSQDHLLAVSKRETLTTAVTDILIARGDTRVVHSVADNAGAALSDAGYSRLIDKTKADEVLAELVGCRKDISPPGLHRLLARATKEACLRLLKRVQPEFKKDVHETLLGIFDRVDNDIHRQRDTALHEIQALNHKGLLDAKTVLEFSKAQQLSEMAAGLALLGDTRFELVADILDCGQNHPLMVACKAAGFPWSITFAILKTRPHQHDIVEFQFDQLLFDYCRLTPAIARRVLLFWQIRRAEKSSDDGTLTESQDPVRKRRASPRSKIHQAAIILGPNNFQKPCTMLDISRGGAKLQIVSAGDIPDRFTLTLPRNRLIRRDCTVVWRAPKPAGPAEWTFGVSFN